MNLQRLFYLEYPGENDTEPMLFLMFRARKHGRGKVGFASCWIKESDLETAKRKAKDLILGVGWNAEQLLEVHVLERDNYSVDDKQLRYFDQACIDGEVAVIFTTPESSEPSSDE